MKNPSADQPALTDYLAEWTCFGPAASSGFYPGQIGWTPTPGDDLADIPRKLTIAGKAYGPVRFEAKRAGKGADFRQVLDLTGVRIDENAVKRGETLIDFRKLFNVSPSPTQSLQAYAFCRFILPRDISLILSVDVDWGVVLWLDGQIIVDHRDRNDGCTAAFAKRTFLKIPKGHHVLSCRVVSGSGGWSLGLRASPAERENARLPYSDCGLRVEQRPLPGKPIFGMSIESYETVAAGCGVEARWISTVDQSEVRVSGSPIFKSTVFAPGENYEKEFDEQLLKWVKLMHGKGMTVVSWFDASSNRQAWADYPDWRQKFLVEPEPQSVNAQMRCCINSPFGVKLARFAIESIRRFDLDCAWFDGSAFTPIWEPYQPVGCICRHCRKKYRAETGADIPKNFSPETMEFRQWIAWRYRMYAEYWRYLTDTIKRACPQVEVAFNHYHREGIGWNSAVPLNPFGADIISATEADGDPWKGGFYTRLMRAYGRPRTEVWMWGRWGRYKLDGQDRDNPRPLMTLALSCLTAGGDSSTGDVDCAVSATTLTQLAAEINCRKPFRNLPAVPLAALHVSHLTDTYTFGVSPAFITREWKDWYWQSLIGWDRLLMHAGIWNDVVFDDHLRQPILAKYRCLFAPFAAALTKAHIAAFLDYVRNGGTLIVGPWFATQDEWGFARERSAQLETLFPHGNRFPEFAELPSLLARPAGDVAKASVKKLGKGTIIQFPCDLGGAFRMAPSFQAVETIRQFLGHAGADIPLRLEGPKGEAVFAHLGVFTEPDGSRIVSIQQMDPFWNKAAADAERPNVAANWRLKTTFPDVRRAQACIPAPGFDLKLTGAGKVKTIDLPPFTWGTVVRLGK